MVCFPSPCRPLRARRWLPPWARAGCRVTAAPCCSPAPRDISNLPRASPKRSRTIAIRRASATAWPTSSMRVSWPSPLATRTPTIPTRCATTAPSSRPAGDCPTPVRRSARNRPRRAWRSAPSPRLTVEPTRKPVDPYCATDPTAPARALLDVDDTADAVHGQRPLSFFDAPCDMRRILPIHVCDTATMRPVAVILRSGKTPPDIELRGHARLVASAREVDTHVIVTSLFRLPRRPTRFPIAATTGPIRPIANRSASRSRSRTTAFRWASRASRALRTTASPARIWSPRWRHVTASADACGSPIAPWPARRTLHGCTIRAGVTSSERRMRIVTASKRSSPILPADARSVTASTSSSHPGPEPARRQRCGIPRRAAAGSRRRTRISLAASQSRWHGWPIVSGPRLGPRARHRSIARSDGSRGTTSVPRHASMLVPNHRPRRPACGCRSTPSRPSTTGRPCPRGHMSCGPTSPTGATSGCGTPMSSSPSWKPTSGYRRKG